jgi:hypothetical protein
MLVPFDNKGNLIHYPLPAQFLKYTIDWREVEPFWAFLENAQAYRGRSAAGVTWTDNGRGGVTYPMMYTDLMYLIQNCYLLKGTVGTWFEVCKRGKNYGIRVSKSLAGSTIGDVQIGNCQPPST